MADLAARVGSDEIGLDPMGLGEADNFMVLKPASEWRGDKEFIVEELRKVMARFPGIQSSFTQPIEMRVSEMLTGTRGDVAIKVFGHNLQEINEATQRIAQAVRPIAGAAEVIAPKPEGLQYLSVQLNRHTMGQAGLSVQDVQRSLKNQLEGETTGVVLVDGARVPLVLKGSDAIASSPQGFENLMLTAPDGKIWPAAALAKLSVTDGPIRVDHEQSARFAGRGGASNPLEGTKIRATDRDAVIESAV